MKLSASPNKYFFNIFTDLYHCLENDRFYVLYKRSEQLLQIKGTKIVLHN